MKNYLSESVNKKQEKGHFRIEDILREFSISRTTFWRIRKEFGFPTGKQISQRITIWPRKEIEIWIDSKAK